MSTETSTPPSALGPAVDHRPAQDALTSPAPPTGAVKVPPPATVVLAVQARPKSPGLAVLFSALSLGGGHLYTGRTGLGIGMIVVDVFLLLVASIPFVGVVLGPMIWIPLFIAMAVSSSRAAAAHNAQLSGATAR